MRGSDGGLLVLRPLVRLPLVRRPDGLPERLLLGRLVELFLVMIPYSDIVNLGRLAASKRCRTVSQTRVLVGNCARQVLSLLNPTLDLALARRPANEVLFLVDFQHFLVQVLWITLCQFRHSVNACDF